MNFDLTTYMRDNGISRIVYLPAGDLVRRDRFHVWLIGEHLEPGQGGNVGDALNDAFARQRRAA